VDWNINDIPIFVAVVKYNGISAAAIQLNTAKSTVSRSVSRLEESLNLRLLERNSRQIRMTSEGETFYHHCLQIMEQIENSKAQMAGLTSTPKGRLKVTLPMAFSRSVLAQHLAKFQQAYPEVQLDLDITSHPVNIIQEDIDIAVMIGPLLDSDLVAKRIASTHLVWVSSPAYAEQAQLIKANTKPLQTEGDFKSLLSSIYQHVQLCEKRHGISKLAFAINQADAITSKEQKKHVLDLSHISHINDPIALKEALLHGAGMSLLPEIYCHDEIKKGQLIPLFQQVKVLQVSEIYAVYPSRRFISNRVRAFIDFLVEIGEQVPKVPF